MSSIYTDVKNPVTATGYHRVTSGFGYRSSPSPGMHNGVDIVNAESAAAAAATVRNGTGGIIAAESGVVEVVASHAQRGNYVRVRHSERYQTLYQHLADGTTAVKAGDRVTKGQNLATIGSTGNSTGLHLHIEVWDNGVPVDGLPFILGEKPLVPESPPALPTVLDALEVLKSAIGAESTVASGASVEDALEVLRKAIGL